MPQNILTARRLVTQSETVEFPVLTLDASGAIASIESDPSVPHNDDTLTAASFDVHTHGAVGHDVMSATPDQLSEMQRFLAKHGVAHYLPTTVTASMDEILKGLDSLANLIEAPHAANEAEPVGIHLEGPFLSHAKRGVHPAHDLLPPTIELFTKFWEAARGHIKLVTLAPELPGATEFIAHASTLGVRVSLGHSNALTAEAKAAVAAGAASATHTFNAMRALDHREPGILGVTLDDDRLFAELICDGIHAAPELVRLWWKAKGRDRALLVTDAMPAAGMPDGNYTLGGLPVTVANHRAVLTDAPETLAGSLLTLDAAIENFVRFTKADVGDAARTASHNPAAMLQRTALTAVGVGRNANLNRLSRDGRLLHTYLRGRLIQ